MLVLFVSKILCSVMNLTIYWAFGYSDSIPYPDQSGRNQMYQELVLQMNMLLRRGPLYDLMLLSGSPFKVQATFDMCWDCREEDSIHLNLEKIRLQIVELLLIHSYHILQSYYLSQFSSLKLEVGPPFDHRHNSFKATLKY